jgi:hydroxypyruvate isomerase
VRSPSVNVIYRGMNRNISRRSALGTLAGTTAAAAALATTFHEQLRAADSEPMSKLKGNIHHSVSAWCYGSLFNPGKDKPAKMSFEQFCLDASKLGLQSVELLGPSEWPAVKKAGLTCAMCNGPDSIPYGWNRVEHHEDLLTKFTKAIPQVAEASFPNIITFSGNRNGMSNEQGIENCIKGLKRLMPIAEKNSVTVVLELLNSKVDHKDYMADHTAWALKSAKGLARIVSSSSTIFTTCRSWRATLSARSRRTTSISVTTIPAEIRVETKSTIRRNSTTPL